MIRPQRLPRSAHAEAGREAAPPAVGPPPGGFYTLPLLILLAVTGVSLVFYVAFQDGLNLATGSPDRPAFPTVSPPGARPLALDALTASAEAVMPEGTATWLLLPAVPEAPFLVRKRLPGELYPNGKSYIAVDPYTASVLEVRPGLDAPLGWRLYDLLYPLHIGHWGGLLSRVLYAFAGLVPLLLAVSGVTVWWCRRGELKRGKFRRSLHRSPSRTHT